MLEKIAEVLKDHDRFIISTHINGDGDAIGSSLALREMLREMGKTAWCIHPEPTSEALKFLDPEESILIYEPSKCDPLFDQAQVHCTVDVSTPERIGSINEILKTKKLIEVLIDHHPDGTFLADYSYVDSKASATGILLYDLLEVLEIPLSPEVAKLLYVAILTDTGGFRFSNTNAKTHQVIAKLIEAGADPQALHRETYENDSLPRFRLFQKVILTAQFAANNQLVWMICPQSFFEQTGTTNTDLENFVGFPRSLKDVEVSILFSQPKPGFVRMSMRSKNRIAVNQLAARFGGGGHARAAGATLETSLEEAQAQVIQAAREMLNDI